MLVYSSASGQASKEPIGCACVSSDLAVWPWQGDPVIGGGLFPAVGVALLPSTQKQAERVIGLNAYGVTVTTVYMPILKWPGRLHTKR